MRETESLDNLLFVAPTYAVRLDTLVGHAGSKPKYQSAVDVAATMNAVAKYCAAEMGRLVLPFVEV